MNVNLFKYCSGLKVLGYLMILLVFAIIGLTYDAVVILDWGPQLLQGGLQSVLAFVVLALFHILLILLTWSYFMVVFQDPGSVPENWRPALENNIEEGVSTPHSDYVGPEASTSTSALTSADGMERRPAGGYCGRCHNGKPPRCHHCSICQRCVLKMDHHCVWVVNCVGARNYKAFLLFLFYTFLETLLDIVVLLPHVITLFGEAVVRTVSPASITVTFLALILNVAFALSLLCFLAMHVSLVSSNTTTIEVYEKKKSVRWKYDLGRKKNFQQVFGIRKALWFFPVYSNDDLDRVPSLQGLYFPVRDDVDV